jgi:alpha-tubulin suppressor-like RCC1 family protein
MHDGPEVRGDSRVGAMFATGLKAAHRSWAAVALVALVLALACAATAAASGPPVNSKPPTIAGSAKEEKSLTGKAGKWSPEPTSYEYTWNSCPEVGECKKTVIKTAEASVTYTLTSPDVLNKLTLTVIASNSSGASSPVTSVPTEEVMGNPPRSEGAPVITGFLPGEKVEDGLRLSASTGKWGGTMPQQYAYLWEACVSKKSCAKAEGNATEASYVVGPHAEGETLRVSVTATNTIAKGMHGTGSATSASTPLVTSGPPVNYEAPAIKGEAAEGKTLEAATGGWAGTATIAYSYTWEDCNAEGAACAATEGAGHTAGYTLRSSDVGKTVRVSVTATNSLGSASKSSPATLPVTFEGYFAVSWGENLRGDLGAIYRNEAEPAPIDVEAPPMVQIAGDTGVTAKGTVISWGLNSRGELGDGDTTYASSWERPGGYAEVVGLTNVKEVASARVHRMALLNNGEVRTWGGDQYGQFGISEGKCKPANSNKKLEERGCPDNRPETAELPLPAKSIAAGGGADYAVLSDGEVYAWGLDIQGQVGSAEVETCVESETGPTRCVMKPKAVVGENGQPIGTRAGEHVVKVAAGYEAAYALLENGHVLAWGSNARGQLGDNGESAHSRGTLATEVLSSEPISGTHPPLTGVTEIASGERWAMALANGKVWGWGEDAGMLGEVAKAEERKCGGKDCVTSAVPIAGIPSGVEQIAAGGNSGYVLTGGEVYSWGGNAVGQLGTDEPIKQGAGGGEEGEEEETEETLVRLKPELVLERSAEPRQPLQHVRAVASDGHSVYALVTGARPQPLVTVTSKEENKLLSFTVAWREIGGGERLDFSPLVPAFEVELTGETVKGSPTITGVPLEELECANEAERECLKLGMATAKRGAFADRAKIIAINRTTGEITLNKNATRTATEAEPAHFTFETAEGENEQLSIPPGATSMEVKEYNREVKGAPLQAKPYSVHLHTEGKGAGAEQRVFTVLP